MCQGRPIVMFKKVALNFPPLEQGPAGDRPPAPASRLCTRLNSFANQQAPSKTRGVFPSRASKDAKLFREANSENQLVARSLCRRITRSL